MRLAEHARGDMADYLTMQGENVTVDLPKAIEAKKSRLIKKLTQKKTVRSKGADTEEEIVTSIELYDAQAALEKIGRHHKLFDDADTNKHLVKIEFEFVNDWKNADSQS